MIRIVLTNQKGGVGKTTSSIEIANALTRKGRRVLLIDFDQQCNLSHYCDCDLDAPNIFDVLNAECPVENAINILTVTILVMINLILLPAQKNFHLQIKYL